MTGTVIYTYYGTSATPVTVPADLASVSVDALVWSGSSWTKYAGTGTAAGSFTIPGVPSGPFLVDIDDSSYLYTSARTLDLGADLGGRSTAAVGTPANTIAGTITGLQAWNAEDVFYWNSPNGAGAAYGFAGAEPMPGATTLSTTEISSWQGALIDASQGDILYATQLSFETTASAQYEVVSGFAAFTGVEQTAGAALDVVGALTTVPATESIFINFQAAEFATAAAAISPDGVPYTPSINVITMPGAAAVGFVSYDVNLLDLNAGTSNVNVGSVSYGNPFPATWGELAYPNVGATVTYTAKGATTGAPLSGTVFSTEPVSQVGTSAIAPVVTPVAAPLINGRSLATAQTGVGPTPTVSWSAPSTGTPTAYRVTLYDVVNASGATNVNYVAEIVTTTTSLPLPPGRLTPGHSYALVITAVTTPIDANTNPYRGSPNYASADYLTALISP